MMVDHVSCVVPFTNLRSIRKMLDFKCQYFTSTGEITTTMDGLIWEHATYNNLKFQIRYSLVKPDWGMIKFSGSLHKFSNGVNYDDLDKYQLAQSINNICSVVGVLPENVELHSIEFGVNVPLTASPDLVLDRLILFKNRNFERQTSFKGATKLGLMQRCSFSNYQIKAYNKSKQYGLPHHILRFEIKVTKMQFFKNKVSRIINLQDLLKEDRLHELMNLHVEFWDLALLKEDIFDYHPTLSIFQRECLEKSISDDFWRASLKTLEPYKLKRLIKGYRQALCRANSTTFHHDVKQEIQLKWNELLKPVNYLPLSMW